MQKRQRLLEGRVDGDYIAVGSLSVVTTGIYDGSATYWCARQLSPFCQTVKERMCKSATRLNFISILLQTDCFNQVNLKACAVAPEGEIGYYPVIQSILDKLIDYQIFKQSSTKEMTFNLFGRPYTEQTTCQAGIVEKWLRSLDSG